MDDIFDYVEETAGKLEYEMGFTPEDAEAEAIRRACLKFGIRSNNRELIDEIERTYGTSAIRCFK